MSTSELLRFPQPDGRTKVIDPTNGETWFEGSADQAQDSGPRQSPFGAPVQAARRPVEVVPLPEQVSTDETQGQASDKLPKPDMTAELNAQAEKEKAALPEYAPGSPELHNMLKLPFKRRAAAMKTYQAAIDAFRAMPKLGTALDTPDKLERYFNALNAFDEFLMTVSANPDAYRTWVETHDDTEFGDLFFTYINRFSLGEA